MTKEQFAEALFRMSEILQGIDISGSRIGQCGGACKGGYEENYLNLCPACYEAVMERVQLLENTTPNNEFNVLLDKLKEALQNDNGELASVLVMFKEGSKMAH